MNSRIFANDAYRILGQKTLYLLNQQQNFLSASTLGSTRAAGDAIENILKNNFEDILGEWVSNYSMAFARRAMADFAFTDIDDCYYIVDVKTHRTDTKFNMPNLTSVRRLARFYEDDSNYFTLLLVSYHLEGNLVIFTDVQFVPIEFLSWRCLTIGALGWGQIQIANSNNIVIDSSYTRAEWMIEMCDALLHFYPKEISKITERITHFEKVRQFWLNKTQ